MMFHYNKLVPLQSIDHVKKPLCIPFGFKGWINALAESLETNSARRLAHKAEDAAPINTVGIFLPLTNALARLWHHASRRFDAPRKKLRAGGTNASQRTRRAVGNLRAVTRSKIKQRLNEIRMTVCFAKKDGTLRPKG